MALGAQTHEGRDGARSTGPQLYAALERQEAIDHFIKHTQTASPLL